MRPLSSIALYFFLRFPRPRRKPLISLQCEWSPLIIFHLHRCIIREGNVDVEASGWCGALYLVPQTLYKLHPDFDNLVARTLKADPSGCAVFIQASDAWVTEGVSKRLSRALRAAGVMTPERVLFVPRYVQNFVSICCVAC